MVGRFQPLHIRRVASKGTAPATKQLIQSIRKFFSEPPGLAHVLLPALLIILELSSCHGSQVILAVPAHKILEGGHGFSHEKLTVDVLLLFAHAVLLGVDQHPVQGIFLPGSSCDVSEVLERDIEFFLMRIRNFNTKYTHTHSQ